MLSKFLLIISLVFSSALASGNDLQTEGNSQITKKESNPEKPCTKVCAYAFANVLGTFGFLAIIDNYQQDGGHPRTIKPYWAIPLIGAELGLVFSMVYFCEQKNETLSNLIQTEDLGATLVEYGTPFMVAFIPSLVLAAFVQLVAPPAVLVAPPTIGFDVQAPPIPAKPSVSRTAL